MTAMADYTIGIDLGGTNVKLLAVTPEGRIVHQQHFPTVDDAGRSWAKQIQGHIADSQRRLGPCSAIGVACPGLAAADGRSIQWMSGRLESLVGVDWGELLQRQDVVPVLNDGHAALLGEAWLGAARHCRDVVMLTLGTGVGGAILFSGRLVRGHWGRAGHFGHISLDPGGKKDIVQTPGSLENAIGECTLAQRGNGRYPSTAALVQAVENGDSEAQRIWLASVKALAAGIASIINVVDPQKLVLGGGIIRAGQTLLQPLRNFLDEFEWRPVGHSVQLELAQLGDNAGAFGAARNAMDHHIEPANQAR